MKAMMSFHFPPLLARPFAVMQDRLPDYPQWVAYRSPYCEGLIDMYFGCRFDEELIGLNTTVSEDRNGYGASDDVYRLYLCRMDEEGFHWAGANSYFIRYFQNPDSLTEHRDWILTHLPSVLMVVALR
jgi:hypothetical protein